MHKTTNKSTVTLGFRQAAKIENTQLSSGLTIVA